MGYRASIVHVLEHSIGDLAIHFVTWILGAIERISFESDSSLAATPICRSLNVAIRTAVVEQRPARCTFVSVLSLIRRFSQ